eukprot:gene18401-18670_t
MADFRLSTGPIGAAITMDWLLTPAGLIDESHELETAILVALGTDRRANADDILPTESTDLRGWWGDTDAETIWGGWPVGSRLWLLDRAKITGFGYKGGSILVNVEQYLNEAMQPFIKNGIATKVHVSASRYGQFGVISKVTLYRDIRALGRDNVVAGLNIGASIPNSVLRILTDSNSGLAYLCLKYIDWLSNQLLPDTAESEWLDRHGNIWLGGRKQATFAALSATFSGTQGAVIPLGTVLNIGNFGFETTANITIGARATAGPIQALVAGSVGNLATGSTLSLGIAIPNVNGTATVSAVVSAGIDEEIDDDLRIRVLDRIQKPPMGGDADDYVQWALSLPGVTRAWCSPLEMGIGTVTLRFMMDKVNAANGGFPTHADISAVAAYLDTVRPVTVKDRFVCAPIPELIYCTVQGLSPDSLSNRAAVQNSITAMLNDKAAPAFALNGIKQPAQTIYAAWVSDAILNTPGIDSFTLIMNDHVMPNNGALATFGSDYQRAWSDLLPTGPAWPRDADAKQTLLLGAWAKLWGDVVDARAADLLERESDPRLTQEMLSDWERNFGLPDECSVETLTTSDRINALISKMTIEGGQSIPFFQSVAANRCGDASWSVGPPEMRFYWRVFVLGTRQTWFRAGAGGGQCGIDPMVRISFATDLECIFRRWKPAHTEVDFDYSMI